MNATETVRKGQRWEPCGSSGCGWWSRRDAEGNEVEHRPLDDPLADTPEGWWEFGQYTKWRDALLRERGWFLERKYAPGHRVSAKEYHHRVTVVGGHGRELLATAEHADERTAEIEALAEAVGGQG